MENGGKGIEPGQVRRQVEGLADEVQDRIEGLRTWAEDAQAWIENFARERPFAALACAVGIGFLAGRFLSRT
jgi:ElaB/YqjD/DUF883 family membrane-anchored ribosome-binding protein